MQQISNLFSDGNTKPIVGNIWITYCDSKGEVSGMYVDIICNLKMHALDYGIVSFIWNLYILHLAGCIVGRYFHAIQWF